MPVILGLLVIFCTPVALVKYLRFRKDRECLRKLDPRVKDALISGENRGAAGAEVITAAKRHLALWHILTMLIFWALCTIFGLIGKSGPLVIILLCAGSAVFMAIKLGLELYGLRDLASLMKVRGFVYYRSSYEVRVAYYDLKRLKYAAFAQGVFFEDLPLAKAGTYVNLIARKKQRGFKVIRVLNF